MKQAEGRDTLLELCKHADVLIEPFRPGVMEKLGLGPEAVLGLNKRMVYARLTGFGQHGKYSAMAGHDNNYLAVSGVLAALGRKGEPPHFPQNILADMAAGGMMCAMGVVFALMERHRSGLGQVVDCAMVDGSAYLASMSYTARNVLYGNEPGANMLDGGAHFYQVYACKDGKFMAVGAIEPQFYRELLQGLGIAPDDELWTSQMDPTLWGAHTERISGIFRSRSQEHWVKTFHGKDACVTPVIDWSKIEETERNLVVNVDGEKQIAPAPRLGRTPAVAGKREPDTGEHTRQVLLGLGLSESKLRQLAASGAIAGAELPVRSKL